MAAERQIPQLAAIGDEAGDELAAQLTALARLDWDAIELRTIDGRPLHELDASKLHAVAARLTDHGTTVCCLDSNIGAWGRSVTTSLSLDIDELERLELSASVLGCRWVRVMSWQNAELSQQQWREEAFVRMRALTQRAEHLGLVLLHENCAGWGGQSAATTQELVEAVDSPSFALLLDVGNCVVYGQDPIAFTDAVVGNTFHVHVKDVVRDGDGVRFVHPGRGHAHVADCLRILHARGYAGGLSLEPHLLASPHLGTNAGRPSHKAMNDFLVYGHALEQLARAAWNHPAGQLENSRAVTHNPLTTERSH